MVDEIANPEAHAFDLFCIHATADADFVRGYLLPALDVPPTRVLRLDALPLGGIVVSEIGRGVARSRFSVAVLSPAFFADRWAEYGEQLASHLSVEHGRIIPLRLVDCEIPLGLDARVSLDFRDSAQWESEVSRLRDLLGTRSPAPEQIACPYPGMRPFAEGDAGQFFGRGEEIEELIGRIDRGEREVYVIGPSGSGKSSLVRAGVLHALERGSSRLGRSFVVRTMRPGERPADRLARLLDADLASLAASVDGLLARNGSAERVLVFIDQLEELFTLTSAPERQRFVAALRALRSLPRCWLVLALRADFFGALLDSELGPELAGRVQPLVVAPLRGAALAEAIRQPAARAGLHLDVRLCDRLVADTAQEPGALPLIQETLRLLWDTRRQRYIGLAAYEALGGGGRGLDVAIARRADTAMSSLTEHQQTIARRVLLRLVSFGDGRADTRRQQLVSALRSAADDGAALDPVLRQLVEHRLITLGADHADHADHDAVADLAHEALITAWPALCTWIAHRRIDAQRRRRIDAKVSEWIELGRGSASLLDAVELSEAVAWIESDAARELGYAAELPALVTASRDALERREHARRRRTVRAFAVLAAFALAASTLAIVAWQQRQEAQHNGAHAVRQQRAAERLLGVSYLEQGRALLWDGRPLQALPYLAAARAAGVDGPVLRMLFGQASSALPLVNFTGHRAAVTAAMFSPDGAHVLTASRDKTAQIWNAATGERVTAPLEHPAEVTAAMFSADGTRVTTLSDRTVRAWHAKTGKLEMTAPIAQEGDVAAVALGLDGARAITIAKQRARLWDTTTPQPGIVAQLEHRDTDSAAFSVDGKRVITVSAGYHTARIWDAQTGQPVTEPLAHSSTARAVAIDRGQALTVGSMHSAHVMDVATDTAVGTAFQHLDVITAAAFSPSGRWAVTASNDRTARVWEVNSREPLIASLEHRSAVTAAVFDSGSDLIVTTSGDSTAHVWRLTNGLPLAERLEHLAVLDHQAAIMATAFSPDSSCVVTASGDFTARVWRTVGKPPIELGRPTEGVEAAAFSPNNRRVVTASRNAARVWDAGTGILVSELPHPWIAFAAFGPDSVHIITRGWDRTVRIWDAAGAVTVLPHGGDVAAAVFSADGRRVATASADKAARVWNADSGQLVATLAHRGPVTAVAFSADGTHAVTASKDFTARIWNAATGEPVTAPLEHQGIVTAVAFSADGMVVTASEDNQARLWDHAGRVVRTLEHWDDVRAASFSLDGKQVLTVSRSDTARIWDVATGKQLALLTQTGLQTAAFSADGTRVVTAGEEDVRIWDAATGKPLTILERGRHLKLAAFSPDGTRVVTARDATAHVWTLPIDMGSLEAWRRVAGVHAGSMQGP